MAFFSKVPSGVRLLLRLPRSHARIAREIDDEMRTHLAMRVDHLRSLGLSERDAEAEALRRFGDRAEYRAYAERRAARQARWRGALEWLDEWMQDVRLAGRQFRRNRGITLLAVLTLALGIGANTAIFTVVHRLLIAPLPYADGDRIVKLVVEGGVGGPSRAMVRAWEDRAHSLEMIADVTVDALYLQDFGDTPDTIPAYVTTKYFRLLAVKPVIGRDFRAEEGQPGAPPVAMISYGKWQRDYGGRGDAVGSTIRVPDAKNRVFTIVGVTPPNVPIPMSGPSGVSGHLTQPDPAIWIPTSIDSMGGDNVLARLRPGVSTAAASKEMQAILDSLPRRGETSLRVRAMRAQDFLDAKETQTVEVLFVAVGALLLIACANVANLLMSRAWARRREFAVRTALGAAKSRLARQLLTESVLLALVGGVLGVAVAWETLRIIVALRPPSLDHLAGIRLESAVLMWSLGISIVTGILFGSAPALFAGARSVGDMLRSETRTVSGGITARRMRSTLIVLEIALSLVLLVGAGLLVRSFIALQRIPLGFQPHGLVAADIMMGFRREWNAAQRAAFRNDMLDRVRAIPGVTGASVGMMPGLGWRSMGLETPPDQNGQSRSISQFSVIFITPNYFRVAGMSVSGRLPDSLTWLSALGDSARSLPKEIVVSRTLARRLFPDGNALGARLQERPTPFAPPGRSNSYTIVGIVDDVKMPGGRDARWTSEIYTPLPWVLRELPVLVRTNLPETEIVSSIRRVAGDYGRTLQASGASPFGTLVREITVGDTYLSESFAPTRFAMALLVAFSVLALVLSGVGLYGVIAYSVSLRTREIGVRMALGAEPGSVRRLVVGGGLKLAALGITLGAIAAVASTRVLAHLLYGVSPADPMTFVAIGTLVLVIAAAACYVPAGRAMRVDPTEAIRAD